MSRLLVDPDQIRAFAAAILRYASSGAIISLRTFDEGTDKTLSIRPVRINGDGLTPVIDAAIQQAQFAADHSRQAVFCPPLAGFASETNAREIDLIEGYVLTAECDQSPQAARQRLEALLGRATMVVESGGFWLDPATGETQPKQHL
ncbi:MAG TPA: hypothetical protein VIJ02_14980, partial [Thermoanaerobaculia bacterium]